MIPNFVPMAAVYLRPSATGSRDGKLFSRPVVAWGEQNSEAIVSDTTGKLSRAAHVSTECRYLGLWQHGWSPSYADMATLLPEHVPGTPHPLAVNVVIRETASGWWAAHRETDGRRIAQASDLDAVESRLAVLGTFHVTSVIPLHDS